MVIWWGNGKLKTLNNDPFTDTKPKTQHSYPSKRKESLHAIWAPENRKESLHAIWAPENRKVLPSAAFAKKTN